MRVTTQDLLGLVPLYLDSGRRVALVDRTDNNRPDAERDEVTLFADKENGREPAECEDRVELVSAGARGIGKSPAQ